jgi:hypothetical protein
MAFLMERLARSPSAHLYHYAPYEKTALRRLASMHATAETAVDEILRTNRMVDLYRVVRESVRVGEPGYSIKNLERFYMPTRTTAVASGGDSLVIYDRFRETGESSLLNDLRDYNRDDCLSTFLLRNWLIERARESGRWPPPAEVTTNRSVEESELEDNRQDKREERERAQAALEAALVSDPEAPDAGARQLMADLVGFHRREAKPAWWAYFDRQERSVAELQDDDECLGGCIADGEDWIGSDKRSLTFRYRYTEQETKLREGADVCIAATGKAAGIILAIDEASGIVTLKRGAAKGELPKELSLMPGGPLNTDALRDAVWTVARDMAAGGGAFPHVGAILRRDAPRLLGRSPGAPIIEPVDREDPTLKATGLSFFPVEHSGCRQKSNEEAGATRDILMSLLGQRVIDRNGRERTMTLDDVLVVAPYNMQVNLLRSCLPDGARVGTVDKFQGQEAEVVIVSMTTSGADDMPRDASFLLSRNRFNVAISRARCLAVIVASPGLLDLVANNIDEMRLANLLCWAADFAGDS